MKVEIIEDHNNTEIKKVSGGFGIKVTMAAGDSDCDWETTVDGNLIYCSAVKKPAPSQQAHKKP